MQASSAKQEARKLIEQLPDNATWEEMAYEIEVRASIERGLADSKADRLISHEDIKREFGITERGSFLI